MLLRIKNSLTVLKTALLKCWLFYFWTLALYFIIIALLFTVLAYWEWLLRLASLVKKCTTLFWVFTCLSMIRFPQPAHSLMIPALPLVGSVLGVLETDKVVAPAGTDKVVRAVDAWSPPVSETIEKHLLMWKQIPK